MARTKVLARVAIALGVLLASYLVLLVPDFEPAPAPGAAHEPFLWHRDDLWQALEARFAGRRDVGCAAVAAEIDSAVADLGAQLDALEAPHVPVDDPSFGHLERTLFDVAPAFGACPARVPELAVIFERIRAAVKLASRNWDATERASRDRLYRLLYGGRATIEELLLQMSASDMPALVRGTEEPCAGPSAEVQGVRVCSGDLIVSRGGAPTSALIARGNDYRATSRTWRSPTLAKTVP